MRRATTIVPLLLAMVLHAQQDVYRAKLSVQGGLVRSLGDITSGLETFDPERTAMLGLSYEHFLSYGVSLYGGFEHLRLSGNDRETGSLDRSLNFLAKVNTAQVGLRLYADNGHLLNYDARFAPFVQLGFGAGMYDVYGDLYSSDGSRYNYWSDGTIRTASEGGPDAANAQLTGQDGVFETLLTDLSTEEGKPRDAWFVFIPARIGMKWRISDRFSAELAYAFNWTFTDHLDDVSGDYPASFATDELAYISNPTGNTGTRGDERNDHFHHLSLGLSMGIGRRAHHYRMPPIRTLAPVAMDKDSAVAIPDTMPRTTTAPEVPDSLPNAWTINVKSIRIERLEVDTLVVRGQAVQDTANTRKSAAPPDTTLRKAQGSKNVLKQRRDTTVAVPADTLQQKSRVDTLQRRTPADTLGQKSAADTLQRKSASNTVQRRTPVDTLQRKASADTLQRRSPADTLQRKTREQTPDNMVVPKPAGGRSSDGAKADPGTSKQEPNDTRTPPPDEPKSTSTDRGTTERIIERSAPPVAVVQKEVVRDTVVKEVLVPDTAAKKQDTSATVLPDAQQRSTMRTAPTPMPAQHSSNVRSALEMQRDHALQMNRMLNERIFTLERYLAMQEEFGAAGELDSLRQRIAVLDRQLAAKRAEAPKRVEDPEERAPLNDSVRFASESFQVRANYREKLEATAQRIMQQDVKKVLVTGHTDRSGDAQYNLELSQLRAEAVAEVLRTAGVPVARITVKGLGQELAQGRHDRNERVVVVQAVPTE